LNCSEEVIRNISTQSSR